MKNYDSLMIEKVNMPTCLYIKKTALSSVNLYIKIVLRFVEFFF